MTTQEKTLIEFAQNALRIMEEHDEWSADTLDEIATFAFDTGLAKLGENGNFQSNSIPSKSKIKVNDSVIVPEPNANDAWSCGNFHATVIDILDNGNVLVEDQDSDSWEIEPERLELVS
jgi:hypothetical protein